MAVIKKKCWPEYFEAIKSGKKRFEIRAADFKIREGDTLVLEEWDPKTKSYTGRKIKKKVGYVLFYRLNEFNREEQIKRHGFYAIQLED
jgi:ASC-1-like (ASCH) protein